MAGTKEGGRKLRDKMLAINPHYYEELGHKGGSAKRSAPTGFAVMSKEKHLQAAAKGGRNGRRKDK